MSKTIVLISAEPEFTSTRQFWTSGASTSCQLRWCTTNVNISNLNWMTNFPKAASTPPAQDCVRLVLGKGVSLYNTDTCPSVNNYVCEVYKNSFSILQKNRILIFCTGRGSAAAKPDGCRQLANDVASCHHDHRLSRHLSRLPVRQKCIFLSQFCGCLLIILISAQLLHLQQFGVDA